MININNKVILITGGANGIGKATALLLSNNNNKVIIIDNDKTACENIKKQINTIEVIVEDLTNYEKIEEIVNNIFDKYGNIDILINNAGIQTIENITKLNLNDWERVLNVNLTANFYITQIIANKMNNNSTILNIISTHYDKPRVDKVHYDISKNGVSILTKVFAKELAKKNITINALAIGATFTSMNKIFEENINELNKAREKIPLKYICKPDDIAKFIYDIINDFAYKTTGSIFVVDGGRNIV